MPEFVDTIAEYIRRHELLTDGARVLVGVSGGPDSMVCLAVLHQLGYDVHALHVNYGLRPGATADASLVQDWCGAHSPPIPLCVKSLDAEVRAEQKDESLQEAARTLRYDAMGRRANEIGAKVVAVGHHRDDQAETLLLNLVRGAGPEGLAGMPPSRPMNANASVRLVRPLLDVSRDEIEAFAEREDLPWRDDPSNQDSDYDRAVMRMEILPLLQKNFPGATDSIAQAAGLMREYVEETITPILQAHWEDCYQERDIGGTLQLAPLRERAPVWQRRLLLKALHEMLPGAPQSSAVAKELVALVDAQVGRRVEFGGGTVWRERSVLWFVPEERQPEPVHPPVPVPWGEDVPLPGGVLRIDPLDAPPETLDTGDPNVVYADANRLVDPLSVGTWQDGDRLQPLGMEGTRLVSDLLTDAKIPSHRRDSVYLLTTDEHPAWLVGHRLDHRVRVRSDTTHIARLTWHPHERPVP
ncbi:tRNA lysidine(34) synthetase TilS [Salinibacter sp. 10B]|uniref:tRNA lysidine(34) synthetase TilS n=1 Tax=Salinibacter sp. 10B TaxID=1923971 RepID=UPI000CF4C35E|nr:tRNA lysidine(34) synthetase TilS [Salinibacter sp. 10B]PQJ33736.1 tRNA lysidine(34) synthetase TilS [Salinibacter sp. 10B]